MLSKSLSDIAALAAKFTQSPSQPEAATHQAEAAEHFPSFEELFYQTLAEIAEVPMGELSDEDHLREDLSLDSLDMIELVMICEKDFQILIADRTWMQVETVGQMKEVVAGLLPRQPRQAPAATVPPIESAAA